MIIFVQIIAMKEQINEMIKTAMKAKDTVSLKVLKVVKGEVETIEKRQGIQMDEAGTLKIINKLIESIKESNGDQREIDVLTPLVPSKMDEGELTALITNFINENELSGMKDMKVVMSFLNENYVGRFDGKFASGVIKGILS